MMIESVSKDHFLLKNVWLPAIILLITHFSILHCILFRMKSSTFFCFHKKNTLNRKYFSSESFSFLKTTYMYNFFIGQKIVFIAWKFMKLQHCFHFNFHWGNFFFFRYSVIFNTVNHCWYNLYWFFP